MTQVSQLVYPSQVSRETTLQNLTRCFSYLILLGCLCTVQYCPGVFVLGYNKHQISRPNILRIDSNQPALRGGLTRAGCQTPTQPRSHSLPAGHGEKIRRGKKRNSCPTSHGRADVQPLPGKQGLSTCRGYLGRQTP